MKAFNKSSFKGVKRKGYRVFTHLEIGYENCEYWTISLKNNVKYKVDENLNIVNIKIKNLNKLKLTGILFCKDRESQIKRFIYGNDITSVSLVRFPKRQTHGWEIHIKKFHIHNYLEENPIYSMGEDNLLQNTKYSENDNTLEYSWIVDENIKIDYAVEFKSPIDFISKIMIPKKYESIINKLNKDMWKIEII